MAESWQDFYDIGKATLQTRRPTAVVEEGDVYDAIIAGAATMATVLVGYANRKFRATFLDGAEGVDLTERARDRGVEREEGFEAIGQVTLTRPNSAGGAGTIFAGTKMATEADATGSFQTYTLNTDVVFGGADLSKANVLATCTEFGKEGNVLANKIVRFVDPIFDPTIVPSSSTLFAGGVEEEADEDLRDRTRGFFLTQSRATLDALEFGARQVAGVDRVSIFVDSVGIISVYVADAQGNSNQAMVNAVAVELEDWRGAADIVNVYAGVIVNQAIDLSITVRTGVDINAMLTRIREAVVNRVARLNPGETLYRDMIAAAARDVDREGIVTVVVNTPAANITAASNQLIRTTSGIITFT